MVDHVTTDRNENQIARFSQRSAEQPNLRQTGCEQDYLMPRQSPEIPTPQNGVTKCLTCVFLQIHKTNQRWNDQVLGEYCERSIGVLLQTQEQMKE